MQSHLFRIKWQFWEWKSLKNKNKTKKPFIKEIKGDPGIPAVESSESIPSPCGLMEYIPVQASKGSTCKDTEVWSSLIYLSYCN